MKKLIWSTALNILAMLLVITSRDTSSNNKFDWIMASAIILIIVNIIIFFVEYKKLK